MGNHTSKPTIERVTPKPNGKWQHKQDGNLRTTAVTCTQHKAVRFALNAVRKKRGEVIVHGKDAKISSKDSDGNDPFPPRDTEL